MALKVSHWLVVTVLESMMSELRGITGDHLFPPPGFNLTGSKRGAQKVKGLAKDKESESGTTRTAPSSENSQWRYFSINPQSCPWNGVIPCNQEIQSSQMCVLKKVKNEEIVWRPFNIHEVCPFEVTRDILWCKGFLNKGFHWPVGSRHAHTDILLLAIP